MKRIPKTHRFSQAMIHDLSIIMDEMEMGETEAIDWALRMGVRKVQQLKAECLREKSLD